MRLITSIMILFFVNLPFSNDSTLDCDESYKLGKRAGLQKKDRKTKPVVVPFNVVSECYLEGFEDTAPVSTNKIVGWSLIAGAFVALLVVVTILPSFFSV